MKNHTPADESLGHTLLLPVSESLSIKTNDPVGAADAPLRNGMVLLDV